MTTNVFIINKEIMDFLIINNFSLLGSWMDHKKFMIGIE